MTVPPTGPHFGSIQLAPARVRQLVDVDQRPFLRSWVSTTTILFDALAAIWK